MIRRILIVAGAGFSILSGYIWLKPLLEKGRGTPATEGHHRAGSETAAANAVAAKAERLPERSQVRQGAPAWASASADALSKAAEEAEQMDDEMRTAVAVVIAKLEEAIASGDVKKMGSILSLLRNSPSEIFGKNGVPAAVRRVMVRAAAARARAQASSGAAGVGDPGQADVRQAASELAEYVSDSDAGVSADALQAFNGNAFNPSYSDSARAVFVVEGSQLNLDATSLQLLLSSVHNMRHSVACDTIEQISQVGSEAAKAALPQVIQRYTVDTDITTVGQLRDWLSSHPDGAYDNTRFGGFQAPDLSSK